MMRSSDRQKLFDHSCYVGDLELVKLIIQSGGVYEWRHGFYRACSNGNINVIEFLFKNGMFDLIIGLYCAQLHGQFKSIKFLIDSGAKTIHNYYGYPRNNKEINSLILLGLPMQAFSKIPNYNIMVDHNDKYRKKVSQELDNYLISDLVKLTSKFCLLPCTTNNL